MSKMVDREETSGKLEWKINVPDGTQKVLEPESGVGQRIWTKLQSLIMGFAMKIWQFLVKSWKIGVAEPKKFIHCLKVGLALSIVSLFYYMRPLYDGVGRNAMWAVMTVVVVLEYTVGATLSKCINRTIATVVAGSLGVGIHWVASHSGEKFEPIILGTSVFIFAAAATFSRFIPTVKTRFDYGAMIFILTFSLVSVSGYRVDSLFMLAQQRVSTIAIGTAICILISMLFWPVWAGDQLHRQIISNLEKLADSLEGSVAQYFRNEDASSVSEDFTKRMQGYKCVLNSKATEETMANLARWEPAHGNFYFGYPWKQYLKVGATTRSAAYCVDSLNSCINSHMQAPEFLKQQMKDSCMKLSCCSSGVLRDLAMTIKTMRKSSKINLNVSDLNAAVQELHDTLESLPYSPQPPPQPTTEDSTDTNGVQTENSTKTFVIEVLPLATLVTLLTETAARIEDIVKETDKLASQAKFKSITEKKLMKIQPTENTTPDDRDQVTVKTHERVCVP